MNGSDWPIMPIASRQQVEDTLTAVALTDEQKEAIMRNNVLRLLTAKV